MKIQKEAFSKIECGLFVLSTKDGDKDNACIINTVMQITETPLRLAVAVNKSNYTCEIIRKSHFFNLSVLDKTAPFSVFEQFGFKSGRNTDKFENYKNVERSENGLLYFTDRCNAYFSLKVTDTVEYETHCLFIAEVISAEALNQNESLDYKYYLENIKPKPQSQKKKGWVCKICGYVYEGENLPEDFVCPLCKHPSSDFEPLN